MSFLTSDRVEGFGCCIYCYSTENLSDEHVIPQAIAGRYVISNGSCRECAEDTSAFEGRFIGKNYAHLRRHLQFPRNSKQRKRDKKVGKSGIQVQVVIDGVTMIKCVPTEKEIPPPVIAPYLPTAGILCGRPELDTVLIEPIWTNLVAEDQSQREEYLKGAGATEIRHEVRISFTPLLRVLAKIAHGFAVAEYGLFGFSHYIPARIIARLKPNPVPATRKLTHLIGSERIPNIFPRPTLQAHNIVVGIRVVNGVNYVVAYIQLFSAVEFPVYEVVVGEASEGLLRQLKEQGEMGFMTSRHRRLEIS